MKPSNPKTRPGLRALLWIIPMGIYTAAMGWTFATGLAGFIILSFAMNKLAQKILPEPKGKKS